MTNKNTEARIAANHKYNAKAYDQLTVSVPKGIKQQIIDKGETINGYINRLIANDLNKPLPRRVVRDID